MRLIIATIAAACSIAVMIDTPRRELEEELKQQWQEYRQHTGEIPAFPATSKNLPEFLLGYTGHKTIRC